MSFPDGLKFRLLYDAGVEFLAPDMGVQFLHGGDRRDLDDTVVKVRDVAGAAIRKDVNGAEGDVYKRQSRGLVPLGKSFFSMLPPQSKSIQTRCFPQWRHWNR